MIYPDPTSKDLCVFSELDWSLVYLHRTSIINTPNNAITCSRSKNTNNQRLDSTINACTTCPDSDIILNKTEGEQNDDCNADRDEEGVSYVFHAEIRNHWDDTTLDILV